MIIVTRRTIISGCCTILPCRSLCSITKTKRELALIPVEPSEIRLTPRLWYNHTSVPRQSRGTWGIIAEGRLHFCNTYPEYHCGECCRPLAKMVERCDTFHGASCRFSSHSPRRRPLSSTVQHCLFLQSELGCYNRMFRGMLRKCCWREREEIPTNKYSWVFG